MAASSPNGNGEGGMSRSALVGDGLFTGRVPDSVPSEEGVTLCRYREK